MVPFALLPELDEINIRYGHKFKTDQFEINIPGSSISLHMVSKSLWIDNHPHRVEGARRVILFQRTEADGDGKIINQNIYLGLTTEMGRGLIVKYNVESNSWELSAHPNDSLYKKDPDIQEIINYAR